MVETQSVQINLQQIRTALRESPEFFIQFFLAEQITLAVPEFHKEIFYEMTHEDVTRLVLAIPRAHAKTTLCKLAAVWYFLYSPYRFILYVTGSADLVVPYVNDIIAFMESDNFQAIYGELDFKAVGMKRQDGVGVYKFRIPSLNKTCILRGLGAGQRVRGINVDNERPQLAIVDDAEDDENVDTELGHKKMLRWWFGAFLKCLNPVQNKLIVSGNLLAKNSILYKLINTQSWRSFVYGCILSNGKPLWEDVWPIDALKIDFAEYQRNGMVTRWFAEMMNQPLPEGGGIIDTQKIRYLPQRMERDVAYGFVTVDLACSRERWADRAAVVAHGWIEEEQCWQILETRYWRGIDPIELFDEAIKMAVNWGFRAIGIESGSMQTAIFMVYQYLQRLKNLMEFLLIPLLTHNIAKQQRIVAWAGMLKYDSKRTAHYALTEGDYIITQQLIQYEPLRKKNDDDIIDCCAHGPQMIFEHMLKILETMPNRPKFEPTSLLTMAQC